jgi:MFS family permease
MKPWLHDSMATDTIPRHWRASLGVLAEAGFRRFWVADLISRVGDGTSFLALPVMVIVVLGGGPFEVGLLGVAQLAAAVAIGLPAGAIVDRFGRHRMTLVLADLGRAACLASIPVAFVAGALTIAQLLVVVAVNAALAAFFDVAAAAVTPRLVGRDRLVEANARLAVGRSAAEVSGPAIAGTMIQLAGAPLAVLFDSVSFVISAAFLRGVPLDDRSTPSGRDRPWIRSAIVVGVRFVTGNPYVRPIIATACINNVARTAAMTVLLVHAVRDVGVPVAEIGLAYAVGNLGFLVGSLAATRLTKRLGLGHAMLGSVLCFGPAMTLVLVAPPHLLAPAIAAMAFVNGFGIATHSVNQISLRQAVTPPALMARVAAVTRLLIMGALPLGAAIGGVLGSILGAEAALAIGTAGLYAGAVPYLLSPVHALRAMPETAAEAGA